MWESMVAQLKVASLLLWLLPSIRLMPLLQLASVLEILQVPQEDALGRESEVIPAERVVAETSVQPKLFYLLL